MFALWTYATHKDYMAPTAVFVSVTQLVEAIFSTAHKTISISRLDSNVHGAGLNY